MKGVRIINSIFKRRSVRSYLNKEVKTEKIEKLLRAGMQAPSAMNCQPWEFIVVSGKENLQELSKVSKFGLAIEKANKAIIVLFNKNKSIMQKYWQQDLGAATQNILLEAVELNLGSLWVGVAPDTSKIEYIQKIYKLDENLIPFNVIAIGYLEKEDDNFFIDRYDEKKVKYII